MDGKELRISGFAGRLGTLSDLKNLTELTVTKNALFGMRGDDRKDFRLSSELEYEEEPNDIAVDIWEAVLYVPTLEQVLPSSLRHLTLITADDYLSLRDRALLDEPVVSTLDEMILVNSQKDVWQSKSEGPNELQLERDRAATVE